MRDGTFRVPQYCPFCGMEKKELDRKYKPILVIHCLSCHKLYRVIEYKDVEK